MSEGIPSEGDGNDPEGSREPFAASPPLPGVSAAERELVMRARQGDILAMSRLMDTLVPWLARLCGPIALDDADDAAQEVLIQILRDLPTLRQPEAFRAWARRIALREAVRHARRARVAGAGSRDFDDALERVTSPAGGTAHSADVGLDRDVRQVLAKLSPDQRAILVLRDLEGLSEAEAAAQLGVALGTVKSRLARAREAFVKRWTA
jgi:RNA polymerase sigma factor (sigma-70 family)